MTKQEIINECLELIEEGCDIVEIFEYVDENYDVDPSEIVNIIYRKEVLNF